MHVVQTQETAPPAPAFRLRGTNVSLVVLELHTLDRDEVLPPLQRLLAKAPAFLWQAPVILGLAPDTRLGLHFDMPGLVSDLNSLNLYPIGVLSGPEAWQTEAAALGLPVMPKGTQRNLVLNAQPEQKQQEQKQAIAEVPPAPAEERPKPQAVEPQPAAEPQPTEPALAAEDARKPTMLIDKPVRGGTQIYADGGADLIVMGTVNPGAEIIADGNIHVYGSLKGRAIAGARGDEQARIFAQSLDPELLAIGGYYIMHDEIEAGVVKRTVQVSLQERSFHFQPIRP